VIPLQYQYSEVMLYEQLASEVGDAIRRGALRAGDRLPSVRRLADQRGVSVATVLSAYLELENAGLIEVRPKSGHYVRSRRGDELAAPRPCRRMSAPARPAVSDGVAQLIAAMRDLSLVPLGSAYLGADSLPIAALNKLAAGIAREMSTTGATYDPARGLTALRRQLARRSVAWGLSLHEDDFVTTIGATEALYLGLRAVARPGDAVAVESPTYFGVLQVIEALGMGAVEVPADPTTGLDLDALEEVLRGGRVRAVVAQTTATNPLGAVMPDEARRRLVRMIDRYDLPLIEDDVYGDLVFDGSRPRPAKAYDSSGRVLLCGSVSKTLAPGYRVGWIAPGRYQDEVERLKFAHTLAGPTLTQTAVAEFLAGGGYDRHLRRLRRLLASRVEQMRDAIAACFPAGCRVTAPLGGFVLWIELPAGVDSLLLQQRALDRGVSIAPGPIFSARGRFGNFVRLSCGGWSPRVEAGVQAVGEIACQLSGRSPAAAPRGAS
jgi:DNA-binding transcriptional MocR family regulator